MIRPALTILALATALVASAVHAGPREDILAALETAARAEGGGFSGFSAAAGERLHLSRNSGGQTDTPSCTTCHGTAPRAGGQTPSGKAIEPMAVSVSPQRYTDAAKVEKWFRRNCKEVLGRECSAREKGDWLAYMIEQ